MTTMRRQSRSRKASAGPTAAQLAWLKRGLAQPGGKLPLFDDSGQRVNTRTIKLQLSNWDEFWSKPHVQKKVKNCGAMLSKIIGYEI